MATIRAKKKKYGIAYYLVEHRRDGPNGESREHILKYIGTIDNLIKFATESYNRSVQLQLELENKEAEKAHEQAKKASLEEIFASGIEIISYTHGSGMAMYWASEFIGLEKTMDEVFPKKTIHGLPRSRVLLLGMIHRGIHPGSKASFSEWAKETSLPRHLKFDPDVLDSQAFWTAMDGITVEMIKSVNEKVVKKVMELFNIDLKVLNLDYTNFFTYISTWNGHCIICKRGHNKQKRDDLRQFSLAMLTCKALTIPIIWDVYEGNTNDITEFPDFIKKVKEGLIKLGVDPSEVVLVFDGGSVSEENLKALSFHYICTNTITEAHTKGKPDENLLDIDLSKYEKVIQENGRERQVYRIDNLEYSGVEGTGLLLYSEDLERGQQEELSHNLKKLESVVEELNEKLNSPTSKILSNLEKKIEERKEERKKIEFYNKGLDAERQQRKKQGESTKGLGRKKKLPAELDFDSELTAAVTDKVFSSRKLSELKEFSTVSVKKSKEKYTVKLEIDEKKKEKFCKRKFGKKLITTDRTEWSTETILNEYIGQECIENGIFRITKSPAHFSVRPQYHWRDPKIKVHVFMCLMALTMAEVLRMKLEEQQIHITTGSLLDQLTSIREAAVIREMPNSNEKKSVDAYWQVEKCKSTSTQELWDAVQKAFSQVK